MNKKDKQNTLLWLYSQTKCCRLKLVLLSLISVLTAALSALMVIPTKSMVDFVALGNIRSFLFSGTILLVIMVIKSGMNLLSSAIMEKIKQQMVLKSRDELLSHALHCEYSNISKLHTGDIISRLSSDILAVSSGCAEFTYSLISMMFSFIFSFTILVWLLGKISLIFIFVWLIVGLLSMMLRNKIKFLHKGVQERYSQNQSLLQDTLSCLLPIKVFSAEKRFQQKYYNCQKEFLNFRFKKWFFHTFAHTFLDLAMVVFYVVSLFIGCLGIIHNIFTFGSFIAIIQLFSQIQAPVIELPSIISRGYQIIASAERIKELYNIPEEKKAKINIKQVYEKLNFIELNAIDFSYADVSVIHNLTLTIKKGETIAIKGISGCGKSTLFLIILGIYKPDKGCLSLNLTDGIIEMDNIYQDLFSYVPQESYMFKGTIKENITMLDNEITNEKCNWALKISCSYDFVSSLPEGINTQLNENGSGLSKGQLQRLSIARALLNDAPIMLFDEATSSLDEETERQVLENIKNIQDKTILIVTHGNAALSICNRVLNLKDGRFD